MLLEDALGNLPYDADGLLPSGEASRLYQQLIYWHSDTEHVRGTAYRRVVLGEKVPNVDKLFSLLASFLDATDGAGGALGLLQLQSPTCIMARKLRSLSARNASDRM